MSSRELPRNCWNCCNFRLPWQADGYPGLGHAPITEVNPVCVRDEFPEDAVSGAYYDRFGEIAVGCEYYQIP